MHLVSMSSLVLLLFRRSFTRFVLYYHLYVDFSVVNCFTLRLFYDDLINVHSCVDITNCSFFSLSLLDF